MSVRLRGGRRLGASGVRGCWAGSRAGRLWRHQGSADVGAAAGWAAAGRMRESAAKSLRPRGIIARIALTLSRTRLASCTEKWHLSMTSTPSKVSAGRPARARSIRLLAVIALAVAGVTGVSAGVPPFGSAARARADEVTISTNTLRDGWDQSETTGTLTPSTLTSGTFGELFAAQVDGQVYAQPIVAGNTVVVATENDEVYGLSAATGAIKWSTSLGT